MKITIQKAKKISGWAGLLLGPILTLIHGWAFMSWPAYRVGILEADARVAEGGLGHPVLMLANVGFLLILCWFCLTMFSLGRTVLRRVRNGG